MHRRKVYNADLVGRLQKVAQCREYQQEANLKMVARDKLMALNNAAEKRVENKRCGLTDGNPLWSLFCCCHSQLMKCIKWK